jgi:D-psicose/D-tagatose/L-ribulose 3-epimerase
MRIGMNLLLWTAFVTEEHLPLVTALRELGFDGVELPLGGGDTAHYERLAPGLSATGAAVTTCLGLEPENNPASPDAAVRAAALKRLRGAIDSTAAMGGDILCGPLHSAFKVFTGRGPTEEEVRWSAEVLHAAGEHAEACGVTLALEPLNRFECYLANTVAQGMRLVELADHPRVTLHYDTHHMHIEEADAAGAVARAAAGLGHVHISENDRGVPGRGQVAWGPTFQALREARFDGWLTIEAFGTADPEFAAAIHIWRDFVEDPMTLAREGLAFIQRSWGQA